MRRLVPSLALGVVLVGLIGTAHSESINGPRRWKKVLKANSVVEYRIEFRAPKNAAKPLRREAAEFSVIGDGSTDVDVHVFDEKGQIVRNDFVIGINGEPVRDDKALPVGDIFDTDIARVIWFPKKTGTYIIRVSNLGNADNECFMGHN